jgi:hypothetical protein
MGTQGKPDKDAVNAVCWPIGDPAVCPEWGIDLQSVHKRTRTPLRRRHACSYLGLHESLNMLGEDVNLEIDPIPDLRLPEVRA